MGAKRTVPDYECVRTKDLESFKQVVDGTFMDDFIVRIAWNKVQYKSHRST